MTAALPPVHASSGIRLVGYHDLGGRGDGSHLNVADGIAYTGHVGYSGASLSVLDVRDPRAPRLLTQLPRPAGTHTHKVQLVDDVLLLNHERNQWEDSPAESWSAGLEVLDVRRPDEPRRLSFLPTSGKGVHRMTYVDAPYAFVTSTEDGYRDSFLKIVDLSSPAHPVEVSRWWLPGQHEAGGEVPEWSPTTEYCGDRPAGALRYALHHAIVRDGIAYCGWWDAGLVMLDVRDVRAPEFLGRLDLQGPDSCCTHTALPLADRGIVALADEQVTSSQYVKRIRLIDVSDPGSPEVLSELPPPEGPVLGRVGPHNLHEMRPGSWSDPDIVFATYCGGGLRVYDVRDARHPVEIAFFVPEPTGGRPAPHLMDVYVSDDGLIYATDRYGGGLYICSLTV
jgi:hypothetical protein